MLLFLLTYRVMFPLDGAGLKCHFHNGCDLNGDFDWFSFDDVTKCKFLRQSKFDRGHYEIGPALILEKLSSFWKKYLQIELKAFVKGKN